MNRTQRRKWNGRHSNLPECCILFFCYFWIHLPKFLRMIKIMHLNRRFPDRPEHQQYVRCPLCFIRGRWAKQHMCDESCPKAPSEATTGR